MAYRLNKTGEQVLEDLNAVEEKTIYPDASPTGRGLMTTEHIQRIAQVESEVAEADEALTEYEIMLICR